MDCIYVHSQDVHKNVFPSDCHINPTKTRQHWFHCIHFLEHVKKWVGSFFFVGISPTEIHNKHVQMLAL